MRPVYAFLLLSVSILGTSASNAVAQTESEAGLVESRLKLGKGDLIDLTLEVTNKSTCSLGDADVIKMDYTRDPSKTKRLLLTVEALDSAPGTPPIMLKVIPRFAEINGYRASFQLPARGPRHYGIFICKDSSKNNSCRTRKVEDPVRFMDRYYQMSTGGQRQSFISVEKSYFFNYLLLLDERVYTWAPSGPLDSHFEPFERYLNARFKNTTARVKEIAGYVVGLNRILNSMPPKLDGNVIQIILPKRDGTLCGK